MDGIQREGHSLYNQWEAAGAIDGHRMVVMLYPEHKRAIDKAGYKVTWGKPQIVVVDPPTVALVEHNGRRRVASVLKIGTQDEWIEIKQKGKHNDL